MKQNTGIVPAFFSVAWASLGCVLSYGLNAWRSWKDLFRFEWCLFYFCLGSASAQAQLYVKVTAEMTSYSGNTTNNWSVTCTVGTNAWHIVNGGIEWLYDGSKLAQKLVDLHKDSSCYGCYTIDIYPSDRGYTLGDYGVNVPWLAFCAGPYLKKTGRVIPLPLDPSPTPNAPDAFAYSDKTTVFADSLGLPQTVDLFTSDALLKTSIMSDVFLGKHDVALWKRGSMGLKFGNVLDGRLKFHYAVAETTNFLGWTFPVKFECAASPLNARRGWVADWFATGRITSLVATNKPKVEDLSDGRSHTVVDWRFRDSRTGISALPYQTADSNVFTTNNPVLQEKFATRVGKAHIPAKTSYRFETAPP